MNKMTQEMEAQKALYNHNMNELLKTETAAEKRRQEEAHQAKIRQHNQELEFKNCDQREF